MNAMKKTVLATAVLMSMGATAAQAFPIVNFSFDGTFTMYNPAGEVTGGNLISGGMQMDMGTGAGTATIAPNAGETFFGYVWTAHNISMQATGPGTVSAFMLFDYGASLDIPVYVDFSMSPLNAYQFAIATLDGNGDGVPGYPMATAPFPGFNAAFDGVATVTSVDNGVSQVPVPAAAWLLGSGLLGLVGVARRKQAA